MRKKLFCCIFLFFGFLLSYAQLNFGQMDSISELNTGAPFPDFSLTNTNGNTFSEQDLKGKITVINFWYEACAPCMAELNGLNKLFYTFKDNPDFQFISISIDSLERAKEAIKKLGILFDVYPTTKEECKRLFRIGVFPTNIVVDQQGKIAYIKMGGIYPNDIHIQQMELLTAFLLMKNNWKSRYTYAVTAFVLPDYFKVVAQLPIKLVNSDKTITTIGSSYMDFNAITLQGKNISQEQLKGKVTVIDFWKQDCAPCIAQFEFFNKLYLKNKDNPDFQLYTFTPDIEKTAKKTVRDNNLLFDVACIEEIECSRLKFYNEYPTIIIIDKHGMISFFDSGGSAEKEKNAAYFEKLVNEIDNLLK